MARLLALLITMTVMLVPSGAAFAIDAIEPDAVVIDPGNTATILVTSSSEGGSCFTVDGGSPALRVEIAPQCSSVDGPTTFEMTIEAASDIAAGPHRVTIQEYNTALDVLLDMATVVVTVPGGEAPPVASTALPPGTEATSTSQVQVATTAGALSTVTTVAATDPPPAAAGTTLETGASPEAPDEAGPAGSDLALWILIILGGVIVAAGFAGWAALQPGSGEVRFRSLSRGTSFSRLAGLFQQNRDEVAQELVRLSTNPRRLRVGISQLAAPDSELRLSIRLGRFDGGGITVVVSGAGSEPTVLATHAGTASTVRVSRRELRDALGHMVDDLIAVGDPESAAALRRWLD